MPDDSQDPDSDQDDGYVGSKNVREQRDHIKELRAELKEFKALAETASSERDALNAQLAGFQRTAIFDRLNIPQQGPGKLFREAYQGELTEEAISAKAAEYELIKPANQNASTVPGVDANAMQRMMNALPGTQQSTAPPNAHEAIVGAKTETELKNVLRELGLSDPTQS